MKIKYTNPEKTEFRTLKLVEKGKVLVFLQFKDIQLKINWWTGFKKYVGNWRFIPTEQWYLHAYIDRHKCPSKMDITFSEAEKKFICGISEEEAKKFTQKYSNIEEYLDRINISRALHEDAKQLKSLRR